jgi:hypothetical protein
MSSLIQIKYGIDSNGNVLSLSLNPNSVGSYKTTNNSFSIYLNGIDPLSSNPLPTYTNFQTELQFLAATGSVGSTGAGNYMESLWNNAIYDFNFISTIDFQSPGFIFSQTILTSE